jgi:hypothetical protein
LSERCSGVPGGIGTYDMAKSGDGAMLLPSAVRLWRCDRLWENAVALLVS